MSNDNDTHVRLTSAERNSIILNESRGIQHPLYYVCQTKSGKVQVRKRKTPLVNDSVAPPAPPTVIHEPTEVATPSPTRNIVATTQSQGGSDNVNYDSVTNRELLERMLDVLQKNVNSNDEEKNSPENERVTQENKQFIDNIVKANEPTPTQHTEQPIKQPTRVARRGRVLI